MASTDHGTHASYSGGCRCFACKRGHADYMREFRARSSTLKKRYPKVNVTEPPVTHQDWMSLDVNAFWFWLALMFPESAAHNDSRTLHI